MIISRRCRREMGSVDEPFTVEGELGHATHAPNDAATPNQSPPRWETVGDDGKRTDASAKPSQAKPSEATTNQRRREIGCRR